MIPHESPEDVSPGSSSLARTRALCATLVAAGLLLSGYLLERHFGLLTGAAKPGVCSTVLRMDCDAALASSWSHALGLPLAAWGVVLFGTLATLLLLAWTTADAFALRGAVALALVAAAGSFALLAVVISGAAPFCPLCAAIHAIDFALPFALLAAAGRRPREFLADLRSGAPARQTLLVAPLAALVLFQGVHLLVRARTPPPFDPRQALASFALSPRVELPSADRAPTLGRDDATIRVDVFTDFECSACRAFARERLHRLAEMPDVRVVLHHFPASTACNPAATENSHPHACDAAHAAEAARLQGKFWPFHDALIASTAPLDDAALARAAHDAGLDRARFDADRRSNAVAAVREDVELGVRLGVDETPTVFIDGRRAPDIRPATRTLLLMSERAARAAPREPTTK